MPGNVQTDAFKEPGQALEYAAAGQGDAGCGDLLEALEDHLDGAQVAQHQHEKGGSQRQSQRSAEDAPPESSFLRPFFLCEPAQIGEQVPAEAESRHGGD